MPKIPTLKVLPSVKRIWHPWHLWECFPAGFYDSAPIDCDGLLEYFYFLSNLKRFEVGLKRIVTEWIYSCEQNLSNPGTNRIAWLGQASMCIECGIPSCCRGGFSLMESEEQNKANELARKYLVSWLLKQKRKEKTANERQNQKVH